jgi:hypothetical protein
MADFLEMRNALLRALLPQLLSDDNENLEEELFIIPQEDVVADKVPTPEPI